MTDTNLVNPRYSYAVYWPKSGQNDYGEPLLGTAEEIKVYVEKGLRDVLDAQASPVAYEFMMNVPKELTVHGILWLGKLKDLPDTPTNLLQIIDYEEYTTFGGQRFDRWVKVMRFGNTLPDSV